MMTEQHATDTFNFMLKIAAERGYDLRGKVVLKFHDVINNNPKIRGMATSINKHHPSRDTMPDIVHLSRVYMHNLPEIDYEQTIAHEIAHIIVNRFYIHKYPTKKFMAHGKEWKAIMATVFEYYNVTATTQTDNAVVSKVYAASGKSRPLVKRHVLCCGKCEHEYLVTDHWFNKNLRPDQSLEILIKGTSEISGGIYCKFCKHGTFDYMGVREI